MHMMDAGNLLLSNAQIASADGFLPDGWMLISHGRIEALGTGQPPQEIKARSEVQIDAHGSLLLPGFIDLHTHGAAGINLMDADSAGLQQASQFYASHGVTGFLATSWTASPTVIEGMLHNINKVLGHEQGAALLGVHLEGPFINPARTGAQNPRAIRPARPEEVLPYLESGLVRIITIAPELEENQWLIESCMERGICTAVGHSDATYAQMHRAMELGLRHVTHTFNGMRGFSQREPGVVGAALEMDELSCEIIMDGIHVHPAAVRLLLRAKPDHQVVLVTDSISGTGTQMRHIELQGRKVILTDHDARLQDGTLAGSVLTMDQALRNLMEITGKPAQEISRYASQNAAKVIGLSKHKGSIAAGMDADLVLLDDVNEVSMTIVNGKIVFQR